MYTFIVAILCLSISSTTATNSSPDATDNVTKYVILGSHKRCLLTCNVSDESATVAWARYMEEDKQEQITENTNNDKFKVGLKTLEIMKFTSDDAEFTYLCKLTKRSDQNEEIVSNQTFAVIVPPTVWIQKYHNLDENEKMTLNCSVAGHPTPNILWTFGDRTYDSSTDRVSILSYGNVNKAILMIENATLEDRGTYTCTASTTVLGHEALSASASTTVRIKNNHAALWPFLVICAEALVLCFIILIYEKRGNKAHELEESDAEQCPEQKNTPDLDVSSYVRQRNSHVYT